MKFFKDLTAMTRYLHEIGKNLPVRDWIWEEGFVCGFATAGGFDAEEDEDVVMTGMKESD